MKRSTWSTCVSGVAAALITACAHPPPVAQPSTHPSICDARIARLWHGRTTNAIADTYAAYLADSITGFPKIPGNLGYQVMRETVGDETHFTVISYWASRDAIRAYAGDDISKVHALPRDPEFLIESEPLVKNYDLSVLAVGCPAVAGSPKS